MQLWTTADELNWIDSRPRTLRFLNWYARLIVTEGRTFGAPCNANLVLEGLMRRIAIAKAEERLAAKIGGEGPAEERSAVICGA